MLAPFIVVQRIFNQGIAADIVRKFSAYLTHFHRFWIPFMAFLVVKALSLFIFYFLVNRSKSPKGGKETSAADESGDDEKDDLSQSKQFMRPNSMKQWKLEQDKIKEAEEKKRFEKEKAAAAGAAGKVSSIPIGTCFLNGFSCLALYFKVKKREKM